MEEVDAQQAAELLEELLDMENNLDEEADLSVLSNMEPVDGVIDDVNIEEVDIGEQRETIELSEELVLA